MNPLQTVALRYQAIFIPVLEENTAKDFKLKGTTSVFVSNLAKLGFSVSEKLLRALNQKTPTYQSNLLEQFRTVMGVN